MKRFNVLLFMFIFLFFGSLHAADDIRLRDYVADGFDRPVNSIQAGNYGFEYAQSWIVSGFTSTVHSGLDINTSNDCGREVKASANGIVTYKGHGGGSWGGVVMIQHRFHRTGGFGDDTDNDYVEFTTQYAHIAPLDDVAVGDYVYRGQKIGYIAEGTNQVCNTFPGVTDPHQYDVAWSAHLHYEVRENETVGATNWPSLSITGSWTDRKTRIDGAGYFLPYASPEAVANFPNANNAESLFASNAEANSAELDRLISDGVMAYTEDDDNDNNRHNKNHVLTKRQVVEVIANALNLKQNNFLPNDPVQYAVDEGLINADSPNLGDFDEPVERGIAFIIAARAAQVAIDGAVTQLSDCSSSDFQDINVSDPICKYANYLNQNGLFEGVNGRSYLTAFATRALIADMGAELLDIESVTPPPSENCGLDVNLNAMENGSWESGCVSVNRSGSYAKFYTFTLSNSQEVTINLESSSDSYLYLLSGSDSSGGIIVNDDDSGTGTNSRIIHTLSAGTYTVEATTYNSGATGSFSVSIDIDDSTVNLPTDPTTTDCVNSLNLNTDTSGSWIPSCASTNRSSRYAQFYTFTLTSSQEVIIDLESSVDSYMFLLSGSGENGTVIDSDDDGGTGYNSRITRTLSAGTYTVEATTYNSATTGNFSVSVDANNSTVNPSVDPTTADCVNSLSLNSDTAGSWGSSCTSINRSSSYAQFYTFTLTSSQEVTIDLESSVDTYVFLLSGSDESGTVIDSDDDGGTGYNSRITRTLSAGTYTVEATTYNSAQTGSFDVSVSNN